MKRNLDKITKNDLHKLHTRYCEHWMICDKDTDCKAGESCPWFKHTEDFTSMREK